MDDLNHLTNASKKIIDKYSSSTDVKKNDLNSDLSTVVLKSKIAVTKEMPIITTSSRTSNFNFITLPNQ